MVRREEKERKEGRLDFSGDFGNSGRASLRPFCVSLSTTSIQISIIMFRSTPLLRTLLTSTSTRAFRTAAVTLPRFSPLPLAHRSISTSLRLRKDAVDASAKPTAVEQEQEQEEEEEEEEEDVMNEYDTAWENEMLGGGFPPEPVRAQGKVHVQLVSLYLFSLSSTTPKLTTPIFSLFIRPLLPSLFVPKPPRPSPSSLLSKLTPPLPALREPPTGNRRRRWSLPRCFP